MRRKRSRRMFVHSRHPFALPRLDDGGGTQRQQAHHGADLEPRWRCHREGAGRRSRTHPPRPTCRPAPSDSWRGRSKGNGRQTSSPCLRSSDRGPPARRRSPACSGRTAPSRRCRPPAPGGRRSGSGALRSKTPILSSPRNPPSNRFLPKRSLRFTHQLKFSISFAKDRLRNSRSPSPWSACSVRYRKIVAQACTGGLTSLKFHS